MLLYITSTNSKSSTHHLNDTVDSMFQATDCADKGPSPKTLKNFIAVIDAVTYILKCCYRMGSPEMRFLRKHVFNARDVSTCKS